MPFVVRSAGKGRGYRIVRSDTGRTVGHSASRAKAQRSINARMSAAHGRRR